MVTCQSSELGWEVTVELPTDFLSLGRGSVNTTTEKEFLVVIFAVTIFMDHAALKYLLSK